MGSSSRYLYRGNLAERQLAEVLRTIDRHRAPGVLEVSAGEVKKRLYVKDGNIVFATSTDIGDSLGCFMLQAGMIDQDAFRTTMRARRSDRRRYGAVILERGLATPAEVYRAVRHQTAEILWSLFSWAEAEVTFAVGDFKDPASTAIQIPIRLAIKEGVRRCSDLERMMEACGGPAARLEPDYSFDDVIDVALTAEELEVLRATDGVKTVAELVSESALDEARTLQLLYVYFTLEFVRRADGDARTGAARRMARGADPS